MVKRYKWVYFSLQGLLTHMNAILIKLIQATTFKVKDKLL